MEQIELVERQCKGMGPLGRGCAKTFRVMPSSPLHHCSDECRGVSGDENRKRAHRSMTSAWVHAKKDRPGHEKVAAVRILEVVEKAQRSEQFAKDVAEHVKEIPMPPDNKLKAGEVAKLAGCSTQKVNKLWREGLIHGEDRSGKGFFGSEIVDEVKAILAEEAPQTDAEKPKKAKKRAKAEDPQVEQIFKHCVVQATSFARKAYQKALLKFIGEAAQKNMSELEVKLLREYVNSEEKFAELKKTR